MVYVHDGHFYYPMQTINPEISFFFRLRVEHVGARLSFQLEGPFAWRFFPWKVILGAYVLYTLQIRSENPFKSFSNRLFLDLQEGLLA